MEEQILDIGNFSHNVLLPYGEHCSEATYLQNPTPRESIKKDNLSDSREQSVEVEDTFGLEFAALQWLNLVTNAEQLFNKLMNSILLTGDEKEQIQSWLYLKQECEECVASDEATSIGEQNRRSLERIEELTEDTEQTENSSDSNEKSSDSQYESETESDFDYHHPDFEDKLDGYMERFKDKTDDLISNNVKQYKPLVPITLSKESSLLKDPSFSSPHLSGRRKSIHPGTLPAGVSLLQLDGTKEITSPLSQSEQSCSKLTEIKKPSSHSLANLEPYKQLKMLLNESDAKKVQIKKVLLDLEETNKRMEELQHTIQLKEQFIKDMVKNSETRNNAKQRFQRKWSKLEEEYYKTRTQLAQAKTALHAIKMNEADESITRHKNEVEKYKNLARHYEKRLKDIDMMINQIAGDSAKKVLELENSLQNSKKQMEKLRKQLRKEEEHKLKLEHELVEDQKKMKVLEEKFSLQVTKLMEENKLSSNDDEIEARMKWITEETERLNKMKESSQRLHKQLMQQQNLFDRKETSTDKNRKKDLLESGVKIYKEKCSDSLRTDDEVMLRKEIESLRESRTLVVEQRSKLKEKLKKSKMISPSDERLYDECEETIEAIDSTIEFKNELICGRKSDRLKEKGEDELVNTLKILSLDEMRTLLYKYFKRVIDLKENGRKIEQQLCEAENVTDTQNWKIRELTYALQSERLEAEQQMVVMQRDQQEKFHLMLRHFAEESSSSGTEAGRQLVIAKDNDLAKLKRENKSLRRRLQEIVGESKSVVSVHAGRSISPDLVPLKQLPAPPSAAKVTQLTRQKNKLIIQFHSSKKKSARFSNM